MKTELTKKCWGRGLTYPTVFRCKHLDDSKTTPGPCEPSQILQHASAGSQVIVVAVRCV